MGNSCYSYDWSRQFVGLLEKETQAEDLRTFIVLSSCGVLDQSIQANKIILPSSALRDEGTSYHYAPPGDENGL